MPQLARGLFVDADLRVEPYALDLGGWVASHEAALGWSEPDLAGLRAAAVDAQTRRDGVLRGHTDLRGGSPDEALELARSADLTALIDLAVRKDANPVAARAHDHLLAIARSGEIHALP